MAVPTVTAHFGSPSSSDAPLTFSNLITRLNALALPVSVTGTGGSLGTTVLAQAGTPGVNDRDKIWLKQDANGKPLGFFVWFGSPNNIWRRVYSGLVGEVRMYQGNPGADFDTTGLGKVGSDWDGWALCNGKNNTIDLSDHFIMAGHMNATGGQQPYSGGRWYGQKEDGTFATNDGNAGVTLALNQIPSTGYSGLQVRAWSANGNTPTAGGNLYGSGSNQDVTLIPPVSAVTPAEVNNYPLWVAMGFAAFVGY